MYFLYRNLPKEQRLATMLFLMKKSYQEKVKVQLYIMILI